MCGREAKLILPIATGLSAEVAGAEVMRRILNMALEWGALAQRTRKRALVVLECGRGRVMTTGETATLTAQKQENCRFGMNTPGAYNRQFVLNILHWLTRLMN